MVNTLIKHEFLRTRVWLSIMFGAATLLTIVGTLMAYTPWGVIQGLGFGLAILAVGAFLFAVMLGLVFDYWRSSYRQTGYFTQSLPVKGGTLYGVKLLWGVVVSVVALLWNLVLLTIALFGASNLFNFSMTFVVDELRGMLSQAPMWVWVTAAIVLLASLLSGLAQYYFAASIGSEAKLNGLGIGGPILTWFLLYLVMQALLFVGTIAIPLGLTVTADGNSLVVESMNFWELLLNDQNPSGMPLGFLPVLFIVTAVLIWRTVFSWNKKVSLA